MKPLSTLILLVALTLAASPQVGSRQDSADKSQSPCQLIERALQETQRIKSGMTRREIEEHFKLDGGLQVRSETRYMYPGCHLIRIDVDFKFAPPTDRVEFSPDDVVTKVSTPYLAYPDMD